jgi:superfamily II DNA or RNA helicase
MSQAMQVLERMYGPGAQYRTEGQRRAMEHVIAGHGQVLAILRTSEGKSLLYLLPCQLPGAGTTVVILPLLVLRDEMRRRTAEAGVNAHIWGPATNPDHLHACPLVFVTVDQAVRNPQVRTFINYLHMANQLDRVVFDECHLAVTALSYRRTMALLPMLRDLEVQMLFLTGTLPPSLVPEFERQMLLRGARMVRSPTTRPDIYLGVQRCPPQHDLMHDFAIPGLRSSIAALDAGERGIIYCMRKDVSEELAAELEGPFYHSESGTPDEKAQVLERWRAGAPPFLVATSAFGMGVDHPAVRWVVHVGAPSNLVDFVQEVGRVSRDGAGGQSIVLLPPQWRPASNRRDGRPLDAMETAMEDFLDTHLCRRWVMSRTLDTEPQGCEPDSLLCDHCQDHGQPKVPVAQPTVEVVDVSSGSVLSSRGEDAVEDAVEDAGEEEDDDDNDDADDDDDLADLRAGAELLHTKVQVQTRGLADYIVLLETWRGVCMLCYHLPRVGSGQAAHAHHPFKDCPNPRKFQYLDAKRLATNRGREQRGAWFKPFAACYLCYNPQVVCDKQTRGRCEFQDIIMPVCWAIFQKRPWVEQHLAELGGSPQEADSEAQYMLWLGEEREVFGEVAFNAMAVADLVLRQMGGTAGVS